MSDIELPFRATANEACAWLTQRTESPWTLARLLGNGLTPVVWLDYDAASPELFGDANGGYQRRFSSRTILPAWWPAAKMS